ncbi:MAG: amidase [Pseudonocardiales bacterium]|nr:amidase [Pseudonocardiales bacterium]
MTSNRVHAFTDDALGDHDATALAELVADKQVSATELAQAAITRADKVAELNGIQLADFERALRAAARPKRGPFSGVPTFIKDNTDVAGLPSNQGSEAFVAKPAKHTAPIAAQLFGLGFVNLGKSTLPEFGLNASTEYMTLPPTRNPWDPAYSCGASSGGAAALVASGAVPIAHANDGGGSIRIPAACCGLVGLKPTRARHATNPHDRALPVQIISEGVVSRTVRDTARFWAGIECLAPARGLPPIGDVTGPGTRRLRVGLLPDSVNGAVTDDETRAAVLATADLLESLGHTVAPMELSIGARFEDDFTMYWALLAFVLERFTKQIYGVPADRTKLDGFTRGLAQHFRSHVRRTPGAVRRLRQAKAQYAEAFTKTDVVLSPVLVRTTPELGYLSPTVPFEELLDRLRNYAAFTPLNNVTGAPAISLPAGATSAGLPIGIQLAGAYGHERVLLELAYELEAARPWRRIQD